jgi:hypothetical protein
VTQVADDMWFPKGSVITDDGVLLVDETFGNRITAFDIRADGALANRKVWASFGALPSDRDLQAALGQLTVAPDGLRLGRRGSSVGRRRARRSRRRMLFLCTAPDFDRTARSAARGAPALLPD